MSQDVVGHVHLLVDFLFTQFGGEFTSECISLKDFLLVHQEDDLVAALGIVSMQVVLLQEIVFEFLDSRVEAGAVSIVKCMMHRVA